MHQLVEPPQAPHILPRLVFGELDEQDRLGIAAHHRLDRRRWNMAIYTRQAEHAAIDQLSTRDPDRA